jgi:hypothetical protein
MSKSAIRSSVWAEMSEAQRVESVRAGRATLKEMVAGLLDGPDKLRDACRQFLAHTDASCGEPQTGTEHPLASQQTLGLDAAAGRATEDLSPDYPDDVLTENGRKRRPGLPKGYVPRLYRTEKLRFW